MKKKLIWLMNISFNMQSDVFPMPFIVSLKKNKLPSSSKAYDINYLVSHKGFAELFAKPIVAKKK